eukprot:CAMPEP_0197022504 /NCGR_PEP_ID=MMETSP1384-20130603/3362_1 /TAXON_ID=29189 /ORGANISM="Ammonia sp." /LENGTH=527 /DNA_ID=CAMNT_0042450561 /DNA_START=220 /DNA_END=1803 /DNA_ORIENTATION=-
MKNVNDDYCDCPSNDDEPGTSACNKGRFWCKNEGYRARYIFSSLVNDGICDCCDGSDEASNARVQCRNVCADKAKQELAEFMQQKKKYTEGIKVKNSLLQVAKSKLNEKRHRKQELEAQLADKRQQLQQKEEAKKAAEDKEREYKAEKQKKQQEEKQRKRLEKIHLCESEGGHHCDSDDAADSDAPPPAETNDEADQEGEPDEAAQEATETDRDRRRRERRERFEQRMARNQERRERQRAEREAAQKTSTEQEEQVDADPDAVHEHTPDEEFPYPEQYRPHDDKVEDEEDEEEKVHQHTPDEEFPYPEQYRPHEDAEQDDDGFDWSQFDEEDEEDIDEDEEGAYRDVSVDEEEAEEADPVLDTLSNSARDARNEYNDINRDVRNLEKDLKEVEQVLEMDFGEKNIYASLFDECYSSKIAKYEYEFCPFGKAAQKEGHSSTDLGTFKALSYNEKQELEMKFEDGQKCWNGPKRSVTVTFQCDMENEIVAVTEPSTCKYHMTFHTPLACLQEELERINGVIQNQFKSEL